MGVSLSLEVALAPTKYVKVIVKTIQMGGCLCLDLHFDAYCTYPIYPACFAFAAYSVIFELCVHLLHILHFAHILHILHNPVWWGVVDLRTWAQGLCRAGPPPDFPNWPHINRTSTAHQPHINGTSVGLPERRGPDSVILRGSRPRSELDEKARLTALLV